jgi:hypothetical protein
MDISIPIRILRAFWDRFYLNKLLSISEDGNIYPNTALEGRIGILFLPV